MDDLTNTQRIAKLSLEMRVKLFEELQKQKQQKRTPDLLQIQPRDNSIAPVATSFAQQRLWFLEHVAPGNPFYTNLLAVRIEGELHFAALEKSINVIVDRHEILRTTFAEVEGAPVQVIHSGLMIAVSLLDLQRLNTTLREEKAQQLLNQYAQFSFDLRQGPLLRVAVVKLVDQQYILLLSMHHIITDGWSMNVLLRELSHAYAAFIKDRSPELPSLPIQYADFALWQREWLQGSVLEKQLDYWRIQLAGAPSILSLPTDRPRPKLQYFHGAQISFQFSQRLSEQIMQLGQQEEATLYMILLTAFHILLWRYSKQTDLVIGIPIANRTRKELEPLIGFFVNTLALRIQLTGLLTVRELIQIVREKLLEAYSHQDLPFEYLVDQLKPERDTSYNPIFQVIVMLLNTPHEHIVTSGITLHPLYSQATTSKFDLSLLLVESNTGLTGRWEYNTDLFEAETIIRMHEHWQRILEAMVDAPEQCLIQVPLLNWVEREQVLFKWNETASSTIQTTGLLSLLRQQMQLYPDAIAVVFEEQFLTYQILDQRANQLAHVLRQRGVGTDTLVGLYIHRSLEMVIAVLAIMKAGGAYVPLDPEYPVERLTFILQQSGISSIVTQTEMHPFLEKLLASDQSIFVVDIIAEMSLDQLYSPPLDDIEPMALIYVIYTSGSTGAPKGIAMPHHALVNLVCWQREHSNAGLGTRTLQFASLNFDVACQEILATWVNGGTLVLIEEMVRQNPYKLLDILEKYTIERIFLPFIALQQLAFASVSTRKIPAYLQEVITAGEQVQITNDICQFFTNLSDGVLYNQYGPTESHVVTAYTLEDRVKDWPLFPAIGKPIAHIQTYILSEEMEPVPIGTIGHIYIGGHGLARGYLHRPDLTAERFLPHPFSPHPGKRLYYTGDLGRYRSDGSIEFVGRADDQVKVRGYRIEPGEIEALLRQHPSIQEAVVLVQQDKLDNKYLAAYIVPIREFWLEEKGRDLLINDVRQFVKRHLPEYMIPSAFVVLETLPLNPNGKVDRRSLPPPTQLSALQSITSPRDLIEYQLQEVWENVLDVTPIGINENFFDLGGESLLSLHLLTALQTYLGYTISLMDFLVEPTIESVAKIIRKKDFLSSQRSLIALQSRGELPPFFCAHPIDGQVFHYVQLAYALPPDRPFYALQAKGFELSQQPVFSIYEIAANYIQEIQQVQPQGPYYIGGWSSGGIIAFEMAYQLQQQGQSIGFVALIDSPAPSFFAQRLHKDIDLSKSVLLEQFVADLYKNMPEKIDIIIENLRDSNEGDNLTYIFRHTLQDNILPDDTTLKYFTQCFAVFSANMHALSRYTPLSQVQRLTIFEADEQFQGRDFTREWKMLATEGVAVEIISGQRSLLKGKGLALLTERLRGYFQN